MKAVIFFALLAFACVNAQEEAYEIEPERELYTDQRCEDCWRAVHERADEMIKYQYPDYETAFWTCCYQCYGQEGDHVPGNGDDSNPGRGYGRRLQLSNRYDAGGRTWPAGNKRYGDHGAAPTFEQDPGRMCPEEYTRHHYDTIGMPTTYRQGATHYVPLNGATRTRNTYLITGRRWN